MDVLNYVLKLVIGCLIITPFAAFLFSWCLGIYDAHNKSRYAKMFAKFAAEALKKAQGDGNDPS